jgi:hypothetical protein
MMSFFFFFSLNFFQNVKNKYDKRIYIYREKKIIRFAKLLKIMLQHFSIGLVLFFLKTCLDRFLEHVIIECEIPFGIFITNMMFKTEKQFMTIFLLQQHDLTMYIKID